MDHISNSHSCKTISAKVLTKQRRRKREESKKSVRNEKCEMVNEESKHLICIPTHIIQIQTCSWLVHRCHWMYVDAPSLNISSIFFYSCYFDCVLFTLRSAARLLPTFPFVQNTPIRFLQHFLFLLSKQFLNIIFQPLLKTAKEEIFPIRVPQ